MTLNITVQPQSIYNVILQNIQNHWRQFLLKILRQRGGEVAAGLPVSHPGSRQGRAIQIRDISIKTLLWSKTYYGLALRQRPKGVQSSVYVIIQKYNDGSQKSKWKTSYVDIERGLCRNYVKYAFRGVLMYNIG